MGEVDQDRVVWDYFEQVADGLIVDTEKLRWRDVKREVEAMEMAAEDTESSTSDTDLVVKNGGTKIQMVKNEETDLKYFKILGRSVSKDNTNWHCEVVDFLHCLQEKVKRQIPTDCLPVFTEHKRGSIQFRGHPNYRGNGQWYDWALFDWGREGILPCRIWCFVNLVGMPIGRDCIRFDGTKLTDGTYAVVETSEYVPKKEVQQLSEIFVPLKMGTKGIVNGKVIGRKYYLAETNAIVDPCCVIEDCEGEPDAYFLVKNRTQWGEFFLDWLKRPHREDAEDVESTSEEDDSENEEEETDGEEDEEDGDDEDSGEENSEDGSDEDEVSEDEDEVSEEDDEEEE